MPTKVSENNKINNFYIITNETKDVNFETTNMIKNYLHKRGKSCWVRPEKRDSELSMRRQTMESEIPPEVQCVIVLGGDGTLLRAARNLVNLGLPFLGINLGHLGYLTEGDRNSITDILERVIADEYFMEERMMLRGRVKKKDGRVISDDVALNDITINRSRSLRVIKFKLYVNGEFLYLYTADGIIISTPTGSTAYNLSCGGPVVEPTAKLFVVTPISPHSLNNRSLIPVSYTHLAVDVEKIGEEIYLDTVELTNQLSYRDNWSYNYQVKGYPYDKEKAKALLMEAGYPDGFSTVYTYNMMADRAEELAFALRDMLAEVNISLELNPVSDMVHSELLFGGVGWDGILGIHGSAYPDAVVQMYNSFVGDRQYRSMWKPTDLMNSIWNAVTAPEQQRGEEIQEAQRLLVDEYCLITCMFIQKDMAVCAPYVHDTGLSKTVPCTQWTPELAWVGK